MLCPYAHQPFPALPPRSRSRRSPSRSRHADARVDGGRLRARFEPEPYTASLLARILMDWRDHITVDPAVCHGAAVVRGTRVPVSVVLDNLAAGLTAAEISDSYPAVSAEAVRAALAYAADLASERTVRLAA